MQQGRITFRTAAIGSAIVFAVWYVGVALVGAALILITRTPRSTALGFLFARRSVWVIGIVVPLAFAAMLWIRATRSWLDEVATRYGRRSELREGRRPGDSEEVV